jgi:hypothetical protein
MLEWKNDSFIGEIEEGFVSEFALIALQQSYARAEIKYTLSSGTLPAGIRLRHDGTFIGRVSYGSAGEYSFTVTAKDIANNESISGLFTIDVLTSEKLYTEVYFQPFFNLQKREEFRNFILNENIFKPSLMYRYHDPNFGIQTKMKMVLQFGLEQVNLEEYVVALRENFYRKRLFLGKPKIAIARDSTGNVLYELVYLDVIDELVNNQGISVSPVIYSIEEEIYYPGSIDNMKRQLRLLVLENRQYISINDNLRPKFMIQNLENTYMRVVPLCYALPGKGSVILNKITASKFKFNQLDFEIDRLVVENSLDNNSAKYLIFDRDAVGDLIKADTELHGPEGWITLEDESGNPLNRE